MNINLKCVHLLYFTIFIAVIHLAVCGEPDKKQGIGNNTANAKDAKTDQLTTIKKEETTVAINESLTATSKIHEEVKNNDLPKEKNVPEKVEPQKTVKIPATVPSVMKPPPKAKSDNVNPPKKPAESETHGSHPMRIVILLLSFLILCYFIIHNKKRIMGLIVEGRGGRINGRRGANVRYRRLNNSEDAVVEGGIQ